MVFTNRRTVLDVQGLRSVKTLLVADLERVMPRSNLLYREDQPAESFPESVLRSLFDEK